MPCRAVDGQCITAPNFLTIRTVEHPGLLINPRIARTTDTRRPEPACDHSRVAGHAAAHRQHTRRRIHAVNVFGAGFGTHKNSRPAFPAERFGLCRRETNLARNRAR